METHTILVMLFFEHSAIIASRISSKFRPYLLKNLASLGHGFELIGFTTTHLGNSIT